MYCWEKIKVNKFVDYQTINIRPWISIIFTPYDNLEKNDDISIPVFDKVPPNYQCKHQDIMILRMFSIRALEPRQTAHINMCVPSVVIYLKLTFL